MSKNPQQQSEELVAHGATGAVVGTTNTQTLTNKTLTSPVIGDFTNAKHPNSMHSSIVTVVKSADETVNNSVTLQNDDELLLAVAINEVWELLMLLRIESGATPDFKFAITVPTGTAFSAQASHKDVSGTPTTAFFGAATSVSCGGGSYLAVVMHAIAVVGASAGNIQLQWAQDTQDASDTKVLKNSVLIATRMA